MQTRRDVLKGAMMGMAALAQEPKSARYPTMAGVRFKPMKRVRIAIIGVGARGQGHVLNLMAVEGIDITAICDVVPAKVATVQERLKKAGRQEPAGYSKGERDFENLCRRDDIDLVYIATPWEWHVPMAVCAMNGGKHAGVEVPAANTIDECWQLVNTSEKTRCHCIMLENGCYDREALMVLNMIRMGVLGEIKHGEAGYIHDLRRQLTGDASEGLWRRFPHTKENGNLYPTHGLGRVANYMGINRGDRFDYLVSMSSPELSLSEYVRTNTPPDSPKRKEKYVCGDMNSSLIKTAMGRTIVLQHDVVSPRPSDRVNLVSGTKGTFRGYPARLFLDGQKKDDWRTLDEFAEQYEHPLWKKQEEVARRQGRKGGRDFAMSYRLILCMQEGMAPDMDVYDAAALSAPKPLSEASVARGSLPQKFPDFTRGKWKDRKPQFPFALA